MFADEQQLLAQIRAKPHDDQLRLVYADALIARGDERGEYISLAIKAHAEHGKLPPEWYAPLRALEQYEPIWAEELGCAGFSKVTWRRGFPYALTGGVEAFVTHIDVLRRLPIVSISFVPDVSELAGLAERPELAFVEEITLPADKHSRHTWGEGFRHDPLKRAELAALCASPHLGALRKLSFDEYAISEDTADVVGASDVLAQLEVLSFKQITGTALERALAGKPLPRLKELVISSSHLRDAGGRALARSAMPVLQHLKLDRAQLVEGASSLLGSKNLATVRTLSITWDQLIDDGAVALGRSPHPRALRAVSFEHSTIETKSVIALAGGAMAFPDLVTLELQHCSIEDAGAIALAKSTRFPRLAKLDLSTNRLTHKGATAFASPKAIPTLTSLGINNAYPSGIFESEMERDGATGMEMGMRSVEVPLGMDAIRAWFTARPGLHVF